MTLRKGRKQVGEIILIYDTGKVYEIDKDQIYEPFPKKDKENNEQIQDKQSGH